MAARPVVVKLGGAVVAEQARTLADVARRARSGGFIVVHGGGRRLSEWLERLGIPTGFEAGLRVTGDDALEVAVGVLGGIVNAEVVAALRASGANAVGLTGIDGGMLLAERNRSLGRVATVRRARPELLASLVAGGWLPVVAPLALDETGVICNANADDVATALAAALRTTLVLLTDTDGVRDAGGRTLGELDAPAAAALIAEGVIAGGMVPKVRGGLAALDGGAGEVVIADGGQADALARALGDHGFGTRLRGRGGSG